MVVAGRCVWKDDWAVVVVLPMSACNQPMDLFVVIDTGELLVCVKGDVDVRDVRVKFFPVVVGNALIT